MKQVGWVTNEKPQKWDEVSTDALQPLDPGVYKARFSSAKPAPTQKQQKPAVALELEIFEDGAGQAIEPLRRTRDTLVLTRAAQWRQKQLCEALGLNPDEVIPDFEPETAAELCNKVLEATDGFYVRIKHETYEKDGDMRTKHALAAYLKPSEVASTTAASSNGVSTTRRRRNAETASSAS